MERDQPIGRSRRRTKQRPHIPQVAEELTSEWFTLVLDTGATVGEVRCETIGTDVGFMGEVYRCHLTWDDDGAVGEDRQRPDSVIVKVPTVNDDNYALGDALKSYEREIVVYETLRSSLGVPMPAYYYGAMDPDPAPWLDRPVAFILRHLPMRAVSWVLGKMLRPPGKNKRRYVLVLEDVVNARPPTQLEGGSLDDALEALELLGRFHAMNWMRSDAIESYTRIWPLNTASRVVQANYVRNREGFIDRYGELVSEEMMARLDAIQPRVPAIENALVAEPWTLLHGDYRLDNLLFRPDGEIVVLDYQGLSYGRPAFDVAYFITTALTAVHRDSEPRLLRTYHDALVDGGVTSYSWEELLHDCRLTKEMLSHRIVGAADILDTKMAGNGDAMIDVLQLRVLDWLD